MDAKRLGRYLVPCSLFLAGRSYSFEHTKVLPRGVRNFNVRTVNTDLGQKTNAGGARRPLAEPLHQELTFRKIAKDEAPVRAQQLKAFLLSNDFQIDDAIGSFTADLKGRLTVTAPILSYGATEKLTFALAVPYYQAKTAINVGFVPNELAKSFLLALSKPENNQTASARESAAKINDAVGRLNTKLKDHDFRALQDWQAAGTGDVTLAGKYRAFVDGPFAFATTSGIVAPTGRPDDPDVLTDVAFGDGQWDLFMQVAVDESLPANLTLNQYAKYTAQLAGQKNIRQVTADEKIDVEKTSTGFKPGDRIESGISIMWEPRFGLTAGIGAGAMRKFADSYPGLEDATKMELEKNTDGSSSTAEWTLGYSTVALYQDGISPIPFEIRLSETRQLASRNTPVTDLFQIDVSLFF